MTAAILLPPQTQPTTPYFQPLPLFLPHNSDLSLLRLLLARARDHIIDAQDEAGALNRRLERLRLYTVGLPDAELVHVRRRAGGAVHAPGAARLALGGVLRAQLRQQADHVRAAVLYENMRK